jgi:hypothetical protein
MEMFVNKHLYNNTSCTFISKEFTHACTQTVSSDIRNSSVHMKTLDFQYKIYRRKADDCVISRVRAIILQEVIPRPRFRTEASLLQK